MTEMLERVEFLTSLLVFGGALSIVLLSAVSGGAEERETRLATFAGGCFWCMEPAFDKTEGVISTTVGYAGGEQKNPTYDEVCSGKTGHTESIQVEFDPDKVSYAQLLDVFWKNIDPTTPNRQFCDAPRNFTSPRTITRISTKRTPTTTNATARGAGVTNAWTSCGETTDRPAAGRFLALQAYISQRVT
jgi:methionine-S-sulfoxide reductase